jgi:hypothetical protein
MLHAIDLHRDNSGALQGIEENPSQSVAKGHRKAPFKGLDDKPAIVALNLPNLDRWMRGRLGDDWSFDFRIDS